MIFVVVLFCIFIFLTGFWLISNLVSAIAGAPAVASRRELIVKAFELAKLKKGEKVVDLGCGDGRALILAAQMFGARGVGVEISPYCFLQAKFNVWRAGKRRGPSPPRGLSPERGIKILFGNYRRAEGELKAADVVYLYLFPSLLAKIELWIFSKIGPKTRVVSVGFQFKNHKPKFVETPDSPAPTKIFLY